MLNNKKYINYLKFLCFMTYFSSYITRINYGAVVSEIVNDMGILKSAASFVITAGFISYGVGQLISGYLGDRLKPDMIIFFGILTASVLNILLPLCSKISTMTVIWILNGFAQAMIWPPLVKIMSGYLTKAEFQKSCVLVSIASSFGTISIYLFAPLVIYLSGWRPVFYLCGLIGIIVSVVWLKGIKKISKCSDDTTEKDEKTVYATDDTNNISFKSLAVSSGLFFIIIGIITQGILRDGITTWMPSYIIETFNLDSSISIFSAVSLPIFSIICFKLTSYIQTNFIKNELSCATLMFFIGFCAITFLIFLHSYNVFLSILLSSIITGCMHGVNLLLISIVPGHFNKFGNVSEISGLLNFFTYIGSSISIYGIAKLSEVCGWQITVICWSVIAFIGTLFCFLCIKKWKNFCK